MKVTESIGFICEFSKRETDMLREIAAPWQQAAEAGDVNRHFQRLWD